MSTETTTTNVIEYDDGSKVVETTTTESEYIEAEGRELEVELAVEAVEPITEATVQIAQIEAERDITIAAIQADVSSQSIEAMQTEEGNSWRQNLESQLAETNSRLEAVTAQLSTLLALEAQEANPSETLPESGVSVVTPDSQEEPEQSAPEPAPKPRTKSRWI